MTQKSHLLGGTLIVAGTAIGAGMLALPIVTGVGGFLPSLFVYFLCWIFMTVTGLYLLELCLRMPPNSNIISIASHYLGRGGKVLAWILYLFLFYSLSIAYISVGGNLISSFLEIAPWAGSLLFMLIFSAVVYCGASAVDRINVIVMAGLIVSYLFFVGIGFENVNLSFLKHMDFPAAFLGLPVIFTSFSYQGTVPSLVTYLNRNKRNLRLAIIFGTTAVFLVYVLWEFLILGIVPVEGAHGLMEAKAKGMTAIDPLKYHANVPAVYQTGQFFSFFAITTSFLGVTLGLFDFLCDGLSISKKGWNKLLLWAITFLPPTFIAITNPGIFLVALGYAGGIGCALLLGFLPTLMIWLAKHKIGGHKKLEVLPAPKYFLILLFLFVLLELIIEGIQEIARFS